MAAVNDETTADLKAYLARHGQALHPQAKVSYARVPKPDEAAAVILLDRVDKDVLPEYCCHGYAQCVRCQHLCWLGHKTQQIVADGEASPLCMVCADDVLVPGAQRVEHVQDHLRADGPHD